MRPVGADPGLLERVVAFGDLLDADGLAVERRRCELSVAANISSRQGRTRRRRGSRPGAQGDRDGKVGDALDVVQAAADRIDDPQVLGVERQGSSSVPSSARIAEVGCLALAGRPGSRPGRRARHPKRRRDGVSSACNRLTQVRQSDGPPARAARDGDLQGLRVLHARIIAECVHG